MRELIIAGIDPGTTTSYALLDLKGNLIKINSYRNIPLSSIIKETIPFGDIIIVGADVNPVPNFVERYASSVGAKLIIPNHKLFSKEKRKLVEQFIKEKEIKIKFNKHEIDALASAIYSLKRLKALFLKIDRYLKEINNIEISNKVKKKVLLEDINIKNAIKKII